MLRRGVYFEYPGQDLVWPLTLIFSSLKDIITELSRKGGSWYGIVSFVSVT